MPADNELSAILNRRNEMNDALDNGEEVKRKRLFNFQLWQKIYTILNFDFFQVEHKQVKVHTNIYTEFNEFSRKEIKEYERKFKSWVNIFHFDQFHTVKNVEKSLQKSSDRVTLKFNSRNWIIESENWSLSWRIFLQKLLQRVLNFRKLRAEITRPSERIFFQGRIQTSEFISMLNKRRTD